MLMNLRKKLDLNSSIGVYVRLADKSLERSIDFELKEKFDLNSSHWKIIMILALSDGLNQRELAELSFVESPTMVPILDKMEKLGLVIRKSDSSDRRKNRVFLTPKSKKLVEPITKCIINFRKIITNKISEKELSVTRKVLDQIVHNSDNFLKDKGYVIPKTILSKND